MSDNIIFDGSKEQEVKPEKTSKQVLKTFQDYFNELEYKVFIALNNYRTQRKRWPTYRELADFMDEKPGNVQPRLAETLREKHVIEPAGKRPCSKSDHNRSVTTWKPVNEDVIQ